MASPRIATTATAVGAVMTAIARTAAAETAKDEVTPSATTVRRRAT